jgi:branched-chain amino acid transport system substrate-binding protein
LATASGGKVLCQALVPLGAADFSSNLLKAQIVGLANADHDATNAIKQSAEFGIIQHGRKLGASWSSLPMWPMLAGSAGFATHVGFCWDENDQTRAWSKRFFAALHRMPTMSQAGFYSDPSLPGGSKGTEQQRSGQATASHAGQ